MQVVVVGGCGHVGLPLALSLARAGVAVTSFDIDGATVEMVNNGVMPFREEGASEILPEVLKSGLFRADSKPSSIREADIIVLVIGTPVDEHANPDPNSVVSALEECLPFMSATQLVMLRSTVYPGVTRRVEQFLQEKLPGIEVVFCPERIVEGQAILELHELPQIVGARTGSAARRAMEFFEQIDAETVLVTPEEAELAKLFTNAWRYIKFAAANQFWLMANEAGLDFARIRDAITHNYPRAADMPGPGFAAGPCLFKDTAQLAAFSNNSFALGNAAMQVNEGQPLYLITRLAQSYPLENMTVGILGMAFKANSDDIRSSLSYKIKRLLAFHASEVITTDPLVTTDTSLVTLQETLERSDLLIIGAPHDIYKHISTSKPIIDIWNLLGRGTLV
jgi:UDP-N-acetyl-D-mannosaminuronic acid dehydrogenase